VMAGQGQQQAVEGRGPRPRRGTSSTVAARAHSPRR
jgi:hypothetical protein